ncbi:MAG: hypothetical protein V1889_03910 [archaeon]
MTEMKLINSKIIKINAERNPNFNGKIELKTNIKIQKIEKIKETKEIIKIEYIFDIDYLDLGKISIGGIIFLSSNTKTIKDIIKLQEEKKFNTPEYITITNLIIQKASIKAFEIEEELGLPIHIKFPTVNFQEKPNN